VFLKYRSVLLAPVLLLLIGGCGAGAAAGGDPSGGGEADLGAPPDDLLVLDTDGPPSGSVGVTGGTVSRLFFGFTGDTRPASCDATGGYPTAIINSIYQRMAAANVQFALDLGDHMYVCKGGQPVADAQMAIYTHAAAQLAPRPVFMTMGNHECTSTSLCAVGGNAPPNFKSFMAALAPISSQPWYSIDINTGFGLARFVVIADNGWSNAEAAWLDATLTDADKNAKYIFVARHHPLDNTDLPQFATITQVIKAHRHTMVLTGHTHEFKLDTFNDPSGRTLVMGAGGAPLQSGTWYGFGTVEQLPNGNLAVKLYDQATGNQTAAFTLGP
jgi:hypothetical protein